MANIEQVLRCELDPANPVQEICSIISAVIPFHPGQEEAILCGVQDAIVRRLEQMKEVDPNAE